MFEDIEVTVDTGSTFTAVPRELLQRLGVPVLSSARCSARSELAHGSSAPVDIGRTVIRLEGQEFPTLVIFAEEERAQSAGRGHAGGGTAGSRPGGRTPYTDERASPLSEETQDHGRPTHSVNPGPGQGDNPYAHRSTRPRVQLLFSGSGRRRAGILPGPGTGCGVGDGLPCRQGHAVTAGRRHRLRCWSGACRPIRLPKLAGGQAAGRPVQAHFLGAGRALQPRGTTRGRSGAHGPAHRSRPRAGCSTAPLLAEAGIDPQRDGMDLGPVPGSGEPACPSVSTQLRPWRMV